ncbi:MAG: ATP-binding protein, partial [Propionibacteriales bacterium]|nr:ATP-binding protein [Propionibacteriales bacterium]
WLRSLIRRHGKDTVQQWAGPGWETLGILLPGITASSTSGELERLRLSEVVSGVLEQAARTTPLVIVVEDLHWADTTTSQLIRFLTSSLAEVPLLLVGTWRTDEMPTCCMPARWPRCRRRST